MADSYLEDYELDESQPEGFAWEFHDDGPRGWGRHAWFHAEENGHPWRVAHLVQKFLRRFRPDQCWSLTYVLTCSKPCAGEFVGGGLFVTAQAIRFVSAHDFVAACQGKFIACNAQPDAGNEKAEPSQVRRSTERRFVLYDFDAQELAATSVYDHSAEAADDASAFANVIVLPIQVEGVGIGGTTEQLGRPDRGLTRQPEEPNDAYGLGW